MIEITVNGKQTEVEETLTVRGLLDQRKITKGSVWINGAQLLKKDFAATTFRDGDIVKVLRIVAGG